MSQLENIANYWNIRSQGYSDTILGELKNGTADYYREKLLSYAPKRECMDCLDIGCGPGLFSILLSQEGHKVISADYSPGMLEKAEKNLEQAGFVPNLIRTDAAKLPFEDESFDYIVSRNLVWNLEKPVETYQEWIRVLKPGGRIVVIDANHYLHYFDEQYKKGYDEKTKRLQEKGQDRHETYGIDPTPINEIARDLPLSRQFRPEWDMHIFRKLGITKMKIETREGWYREQMDEDEELIGEFIVCAEK